MKRLFGAALAAVLFFAALPLSHSSALARSSAHGCGIERWNVKTLTDADIDSVDFTPRSATVDFLRSLNGGAPEVASLKVADEYANRRLEVEKHTVSVRALLVGWKRENDRDFHVVIAQPGQPRETMIAEAPDPACSTSPKAVDFGAVRSALVRCFGEPSKRYKRLPPMIVDLAGVPFMDVPHGQTGHAPNNVEIHPILSVKTLSGACPR